MTQVPFWTWSSWYLWRWMSWLCILWSLDFMELWMYGCDPRSYQISGCHLQAVLFCGCDTRSYQICSLHLQAVSYLPSFTCGSFRHPVNTSTMTNRQPNSPETSWLIQERKMMTQCVWWPNWRSKLKLGRPIEMRDTILYLANRWTKFEMLLTWNRFLNWIRFLLLSFSLISQFIAQFRPCSSPYLFLVSQK